MPSQITRILILSILLLMTIRPHSFAAPSEPIALTQEEKVYLHDHPVFKVAVLSDFIPFSFSDQGTFTGFSKSLLDLISQKTGLKFSYQMDYWPNNLQKFQQGTVDIIDSISFTTERTLFTLYTPAYYAIPNVIFINNSFGEYKGLQSLRGKAVGLQRDIYYEDTFRDLVDMKVVEFDDYEEMIKAVSYGRLDATVLNVASGNYFIKKNVLTNLVVADELRLPNMTNEDLRFGIRKELPILYNIMNKGIHAITTREWETIKNQWIGPKYAINDRQTTISLTPEETQFIKNNSVLKISNEMDWPPFDFVENKTPTGYSIDYMHLLEKRIPGVRFEFINGFSWVELVALFKEKKIDILQSIGRTPNREKYMLFTEPFLNMFVVIVTRNDTDDILSMKDMQNRKLAAVKGYNIPEIISRDYPKIHIVYFSDPLNALKGVSSGRADAYLETQAISQYLMKKYFITNLKIAAPLHHDTLQNNPLNIAVHLDRSILRDILQKAMNSVTETEIQDLRKKWFQISSTIAQTAAPLIRLLPEEKKFIHTHKTIRVSNELDWPPFDFAVDGLPQGLSIDILRRIETLTGLSFTFVNGFTWNDLLKRFKQGELDFLQSVYVSEDRKKIGLFTSAYYSDRTMYITRFDAKPIDDLSQIDDRPIAIPKGWAIEEFLTRHYPMMHQLIVPDMMKCFEAVQNGTAYATIELESVARYHMRKNFWRDLKIAGWFHEFDQNKTKSLHFLIRKDWPELVAIINKAIALIPPGEIESLEEKWLGKKNQISIGTLSNLVLTDQERNYLQQKKEFKYAMLPYGFPIGFIDGKGVHQGITREYVDLFNSQTGIPFTSIPVMNDEALSQLIQSGECDLVIATDVTPHKQAFLDFTSPYLDFPLVLVTTMDKPFINEINDIRQNPLGVVRNRAISDRLQQKYSHLQLIFFNRLTEGLSAVKQNKIYAMIDALPVVNSELRRPDNASLKISGKLDESVSFCVGVPKNKRALLGIMEMLIKSIAPSDHRRILDKWYTVKIEETVNYDLLWKMGAILALFVSIVLFWNRSLRREIKKRKKVETELRTAQTKAIAASQAKSEFLANMSHEIRTPMNGVISAADLALMENISPKIEEYLEIIQESGNILLNVINDILDFSKIEAGLLELEETQFSLSGLMKRMGDLFSAKASEKRIEYLIDLDPTLPDQFIGDGFRLQQVLTNLIGNAFKFTDKAGMIMLGVKQGHRSSDRGSVVLEFFVRDTGIGMHKSDISKLFQPFTQSDASMTRKYGGTGLGLSICKQLIEMMGGHLGVESEYGAGTVFYFTCRLQKTPQMAMDLEHDIKRIKKLSVLVVDDHEECRQILNKILKRWGCHPLLTDSAADALKILADGHQKVDLVLLDNTMPIMNGFEAAQTIRTKISTSLPIVLLCEFGQNNGVAEGHTIDAMLYKPVTPVTLFQKLAKILGFETKKTIKKDSAKKEIEGFMQHLNGTRVLLAEDNPTNQMIAKAYLKRVGIKVDLAQNGLEACAMIDKKSYDLILMDMQMPQMDGYAASREIRRHQQHAHLPIIAMTAHAMKGDEQKCLNAGMNGYIAKPINPKHMYAELVRLMKKT